MSNTTQNKKSKPEIKLPFISKKTDAGEWAYDHRTGLLVTFVAAIILVLVALFVTITINKQQTYDAILIDMLNELEQQEQIEQEKEIVEALDFSDIANLSSNENASELNENLRDAKNTDASQIYQEAEEVANRVKGNRQMYEQGLREEAAIANSAKLNKDDQSKVRENVKIQGSVTVSFSFANPVRNSVNLTVPAYMCQGGGQVVVDATLDRNGRVIAASVNKARSTSDNCMVNTAVSAARSSRFNLDTSAPDKHQGTITYIFIPQ